jgi:hypothetical protein
MSVLGRRLRTVGTAAAACVIVVLSSGCGGDDGEAADDGTTTSTSETTIASTTTTQDPEAEVEAAYLAYWEMAKRLSQNPDPRDPELAQRASGTNLDQVIDNLTTLQAQGRAIRFGRQYRHDVLSVELTGAMALVRDCSVDDAATINATTGREVSASVTTALLEASLTLEDGSWRVGSIQRLDAWNGVTECS